MSALGLDIALPINGYTHLNRNTCVDEAATTPDDVKALKVKVDGELSANLASKYIG